MFGPPGQIDVKLGGGSAAENLEEAFTLNFPNGARWHGQFG
jgi:hypothetical protein